MPVTFDQIADAINHAFRDHNTFGLPLSGDHEPVKRAIREALGLVVIALDDGGFVEPPDWAADLAAVVAQLEDLEAFANNNASLNNLGDVILGTPAVGQVLTYRDGKWRNGGDLLVVGSYGSLITSPGVLLARNMEDGETEAGHGFVEASYFRRDGASAFAAFDAATNMVGFSFDHFAALQARPRIQFANSNQVMTNLYGVFDQPLIDAGKVTNRYGVYIDAPTLGSGGSIDNHYGVYVATLTGNVSAWNIFAPGKAPSKLGGTLTIGNFGATSVDPGLTISRDLFDGLTGSGHGFVEASYFRRGGGVAFASFDAFTTMAGNSFHHGVGFQSRLKLQFADAEQVMADLYGLFDLPTIDTGTVTRRYGAYIAAPLLSNGGAIDHHYGVYVEDLSGDIDAFAFFSAGDTPSHLSGALSLGAQMTFVEIAAPAAPAANGVHVFAQDNGAGKTQLMARFATGAAQQLAIEPA